MQERQVTVGRVRHRLDDPFFVLATQNPIEQEGTYPLPEAQQDRFMFKVFVKYPSFNEEFEIARRTTALIDRGDHAGAVAASRSWNCRSWCASVPVTDHVIQLHAGPGAADAHRRAGRAEVHPRLAVVGRRPACGAEPDPRRQGPGPALRPRPRPDRGHPGAGLPGAAAPHPDQLHRRLGRHHAPTRSSRSCSRRRRARKAN